ncbi:hypothetical protein ACVIRO_006056 [Rhizobium ruizarguesonis]
MGGFENRLIVEGEIGSAGFSHLSDKCSLAGSAWSYDEDDWNYRSRLIGSQWLANWNLQGGNLEGGMLPNDGCRRTSAAERPTPPPQNWGVGGFVMTR